MRDREPILEELRISIHQDPHLHPPLTLRGRARYRPDELPAYAVIGGAIIEPSDMAFGVERILFGPSGSGYRPWIEFKDAWTRSLRNPSLARGIGEVDTRNERRKRCERARLHALPLKIPPPPIVNFAPLVPLLSAFV